MESNSVDPGTGPVTPDEALRTLTEISADQTVLWDAAQPPQWIMAGFAVCLGILVTVNCGFPESWETAQIIIGPVLCVAMVVLMITWGKVRKVKTSIWAQGTRVQTIIGLVALTIIFLPLFMHVHVSLLAGVWMGVVAGLAYFGITWWTWKKTTKTIPRTPTPR